MSELLKYKRSKILAKIKEIESKLKPIDKQRNVLLKKRNKFYGELLEINLEDLK